MFFKLLFVIGIMLPEISSDIVDLNSKLIIWYFWICEFTIFFISFISLLNAPHVLSKKKNENPPIYTAFEFWKKREQKTALTMNISR